MTDTGPVTRIDPFPFQHRVAELMLPAAPSLAASAAVQSAVQTLAQGNTSAAVVLGAEQRPIGIHKNGEGKAGGKRLERAWGRTDVLAIQQPERRAAKHQHPRQCDDE